MARPIVSQLLFQFVRDRSELVQRRLQILCDFGGDHIGIGKVSRVFQAVILQPEDVQANLVALDQFVIGKDVEARPRNAWNDTSQS